MPINITMPALSPTMEEGNLAKWLVKEGDTVSSGDVIAEIETDKATMEVEAVDEGTIARILVPAGTEGVKVNATIAVLAGEDEDVAAAAAAGANGGGAAASESPAPASPPPASPPPANPGEESKAPAEAAASTGTPAPGADRSANGRVFASPLARRLAREADLDIAAIHGSGPHGRVIQRDVEAAIAGGVKTAPQAPSPSAAAAAPPATRAMADEQIMKLFAEGSYEIVPHDGMRKTIAKRLVEAKSTIPHFYLTIDCTLDALLALRAELNNAAPTRKRDKGDKGEDPVYKLSVNDMVIKAMALALRDVPEANVSWTESGMLKHHHADVGVAVSIPGGLITPIIRRAEEKSLSTISNEMKDLAARARERKLKPEEYQGGTSAVSNLGMFGIKDFAAVINPPHATILAVGAGQQRAVVKEDGTVAAATVMSVTLSTDHRAVDGALGAQLLAAFRTYIENPMGMLV